MIQIDQHATHRARSASKGKCTWPLLALRALIGACVLAPTSRAQAQDLDDLQEQAIKAAVRQVAPSVVQIETSGGTDIISAGPRGAMIRKGIGPTSGLIVSPDGYIVSSAFNFANKPSSIIIAVPGQKERLVATVVATDQTRMLTLLKVQAAGLSVPKAAPKAGIKIGHTAIAVGRTLAANIEQPPSVSVGIISALERIWGKAIQTDAKVSPTNYGGPLIDLQGRVQGVLVPASPRAEGETAGFEWYDSGIGFAIPLEDINVALPRLKQGKDLKRGLLGITMQSADMYGSAPVVGTVAPGSAAEKAGIKTGDAIKEIDGKPVASQAQLLHRLGPKYDGDTVALKIQRGKDEINLPAVILAGAVAAHAPPFIGILPVRDDSDPGVEVRYIYPKSPAETAGIKVGDRLMKVGRAAAAGQPAPLVPVTNRDQLLAFLDPGVPGMKAVFEVKRKDGGKVEQVTVTLSEMPEAVPEKSPEKPSAKKALGKTPPKKEKAETGYIKRGNEAGDRTYWIYVPENYDPNVSHAVLIWLHPPGKSKERDIDNFLFAWQGFCEDNSVIVIGPNAENDTGWTPGDAALVQEGLKHVSDNYTVDRRRVVVHGMDQGGQMAFYLGFNARSQVRGVATVAAAMTSNPKDRVANQPLSFFIVAGGKDPLKDSIKETRTKLVDLKYPVVHREVAAIGHEYLDAGPGLPALEELVRWLDSLDRF